jgi:hypothetical protein
LKLAVEKRVDLDSEHDRELSASNDLRSLLRLRHDPKPASAGLLIEPSLKRAGGIELLNDRGHGDQTCW